MRKTFNYSRRDIANFEKLCVTHHRVCDGFFDNESVIVIATVSCEGRKIVMSYILVFNDQTNGSSIIYL